MTKRQATTSMVPVIDVDRDKCVNCHMCIAVCPVKYCIDGSGDKVAIDHDLCIGCGSCVQACTQKARGVRDDLSGFRDALAAGTPMIAIAAPALVSCFPGLHRNFLGWLKRAGVDACFDVGFGAELTVKSYVDHLRRNDPPLVIAQPCPAIVSYVEVYRPDLLKHLAPADSPMLHTVKMVRTYYPRYRDHKVLVLSPCAAKRREFEETGIGDYNVTFKSFAALLETLGVDLSREAAADFDNPPAERAVVFSTPGGLMRTAMRELPGIESRTRKIEGPDLVYRYLDTLSEAIERRTNPLLVDCLNCEFGCNAGPGTINLGKSPDDIERPVELRREEGERANKTVHVAPAAARKRIDKVLSRFWRPGLYSRDYVDRSANYRLKTPSANQFDEIYKSMLKECQDDHLNCAACGYKSCEGMAIAIWNGLNKKENCHLYSLRVIEKEQEIVDASTTRLHGEIASATAMIDGVRSAIERLQGESATQFRALEASASAVESMIARLSEAAGMASGKREQIERLASVSGDGERDMVSTVGAIRKVSDGVSGIGELRALSAGVRERYAAMASEVGSVLGKINVIATISEETRRTVAATSEG